ncbi:hypothetical protein GCM10011316_38880 [Roseibium aquae]|uniref:Surface antigen domain-containing protein n=1 Tax=Roseibium aquae TaxID=1323746 RepID=A0A916TNP5_9HYPH|nr:RT0821/Lpp0805 family surface protein [Roseibium aquae]GGB63226.1 hypothetical protein GCM10011316_38880 [Roseibium aquae]
MPARTVQAILLLATLTGCSALSASDRSAAGYGTSFGAQGMTVADEEASTAIAVLQNGELGAALTETDWRAAAQAQKQALRADGVGAAISWRNARTGRSGEVRPGPVYVVNDTTCREFTHEMQIDGRQMRARGTACRGDNGVWQTLS